MSSGVALLGANNDMTEASSLTYKNDIVDVYSNSWGPPDSGFHVEGPGHVVKLALKTGAQEVLYNAMLCANPIMRIALTILSIIIYCRAVMEKDLFFYGLMVMEARLMTVQVMATRRVSTLYLLELLE